MTGKSSPIPALAARPARRDASSPSRPAAGPHVQVFDVTGSTDARAATARVLMVTDNTLLGAGVAQLLGKRPVVAAELVVIEPASLARTPRYFGPHPDLLVIDEASPDAVRQLESRFGGVQRLRLVHGHHAQGQVGAALPADGDDHEVSVHGSLGELSDALREVLGGIGGAPAVRDAADAAPVERLTPRQREVAGLLQHGLSNKEIARRMCLAPGTVKLHVTAVLKGLNARNRLQVVVEGLCGTGAPHRHAGAAASPPAAVGAAGESSR